jgi:uncharacterized cupin superfamily protein
MPDGAAPAVAAPEVAPAPAAALPEPFASRLRGRERRPLGEVFGLKQFGVNLTRLPPGAASALRHAHALQDEFVFILQGTPTLVTDAGERLLRPLMCAGFRAGTGDAHHLVNRSAEDVLYLEVGDRTLGDSVTYPDDDLAAFHNADGGYTYVRGDGSVTG